MSLHHSMQRRGVVTSDRKKAGFFEVSSLTSFYGQWFSLTYFFLSDFFLQLNDRVLNLF